jgi:hypothetical protein
VAPSPILTRSLSNRGPPVLPNSLLDAASAGEITHSDSIAGIAKEKLRDYSGLSVRVRDGKPEPIVTLHLFLWAEERHSFTFDRPALHSHLTRRA